MLDKIKDFYKTNSMYVNIALVGLAAFLAWKLFKK